MARASRLAHVVALLVASVTNSEIRATAAAAIRAKAPTDEVWRVVEVDSVTTRDIPELADSLDDASTAATGDRGPATVAVMAKGRQGGQAVDITAFTVLRSRLALELAMDGRGRGLAVLDLVESALSEMQVGGLPELLVESQVAPLPESLRDQDPTVYVYITTVTVPPASIGLPIDDAPLTDEPRGAAVAIRERCAEVIADALGLTTSADDLRRRGETAVDWYGALRRRLVPRARVTLAGERQVIGGSHDVDVVRTLTWTTSDGRSWSCARVMEQDMTVTIDLWHRTEGLVERAARRVAASLDASALVWPGEFYGRVLQSDDTLRTEVVTGGEHERLFQVAGRIFAGWDEEAGLARIGLLFRVTVDELLEPATQRATLTTIETTCEIDAEPPIG